MIVTEYYMTRSDGAVLNRTYSDAGVYIMRDGVEYAEAIDPAGLGRAYTESDRAIVGADAEVAAEEAMAEPGTNEAADMAAALALLGVAPEEV